jgi:hypothetical protein
MTPDIDAELPGVITVGVLAVEDSFGVLAKVAD